MRQTSSTEEQKWLICLPVLAVWGPKIATKTNTVRGHMTLSVTLEVSRRLTQISFYCFYKSYLTKVNSHLSWSRPKSYMISQIWSFFRFLQFLLGFWRSKIQSSFYCELRNFKGFKKRYFKQFSILGVSLGSHCIALKQVTNNE